MYGNRDTIMKILDKQNKKINFNVVNNKKKTPKDNLDFNNGLCFDDVYYLTNLFNHYSTTLKRKRSDTDIDTDIDTDSDSSTSEGSPDTSWLTFGM
jgi:hypothetical protein